MAMGTPVIITKASDFPEIDDNLMYRNPKTGESIFVDSKFYLYFRPSKNLQNSINN